MIVLDAAALVDVVIDQRAKDWVLDQLSGQEICAPAHQPAEVPSALSRLRRSGILDRDGELMALDEATSLDEELVLPTALHLRQSAQMSDRIRVVDGLYVALAQDRGVALVTTDRRLGASGAPCEVRIPPEAQAPQ